MSNDRVRLSPAEREQAVAHLNACTRDGRLSLDEFTRRVDVVYAAETFGDLAPVFADLPKLPAIPGHDVSTEEVLAPVSSVVSRKGRWVVPPKLVLRGKASYFKLDCSEAVIDHRQVDIEIEAKSSTITLIVPEGATAEQWLELHAATVINRAQRSDAGVVGGGGVAFRIHGSLRSSTMVIRRKRRFLWWRY